MKTKLVVWASWIGLLMSAVSEYGFDVDFPLTPTVWLVIVLFTVCAGTVHGATNSWDNSGGGKWEDGTKWSAGTPTNSNAANLITNATTKTVTIDATTTNAANLNSLTISNLVMSAPLNANTTNTLLLDNAGTNVPLHILNGFTLGTNAVLVITNSAVQVDGYFPGGFIIDGGAATLAGPLAVLSGTTIVGYTGFGSLTVSNGTVTGYVGVGFGTLVLAGGNLRAGLGINDGGTVWMTGGQLVTTNGEVIVSEGNMAQMTVSNGTWSGGVVQVGFSGDGTLTIAGGSTTLLGSLRIGAGEEESRGTMWVTGGELTTTNGDVVVGDESNFSSGRVTVSNGTWRAAAIYIGNLLPLPYDEGGGTLTIDGGTVIADVLYWGGSFTTDFVFSSGKLTTKACYLDASIYHTGVIVGTGGDQAEWTMTDGDQRIFGPLRLGSTASTGYVWLASGTLETAGAEVDVGCTGVGQITVSNGIWLASDVRVAAQAGSQGSLTIVGGTALVYSNLVVGDCISNSVGQVMLKSGVLAVTNAAHTAVLDLRDGTLTLNSGTLRVDRFVMTNSCGFFSRTGGTLIYGTAVLDPNRDDDGDGIPNGYEQSHGLDPLNSGDANLDSDGDGISNLQEFQAGTDPTNSASFFGISGIVKTNNDIRVTWQTGVSKTNALERTAGAAGNFATNNFSAIFSVTNTVGASTNFLDIGAATNAPARYYRVRLVP